MEDRSRLERARRQIRVARYSLGAAAVAGFALFAIAARAAHPGTRTHAPTTSSTSYGDTEQSTQTFDFGGGSISPSTATPSVQTGGS